MRISLNWLRELVDISISTEELAEILTIAGFEVEAIEDLRSLAEGVVVGKVVDRQPHPNADKLSLCQVDIGQGTPSQIVCGAANVRADIFVPVATLGSYLPAINLKLKPVKLRGIASQGMICSLAELGLEKESAGIYIFESDNLSPGMDVRPLLGLDDVILDLSTTANRADALSLVGVAREVAALTGAKLHLPSVNPHPEVNSTELAIQLSESQACSIYVGTSIEGVKISQSPDWLKNKLKGAGIRPINNVVDVTNYILLEWGQPLHAFDKDKLLACGAGKLPLTLGVRYSQAGESLKTLDGQNRPLVSQNLLITANNQPVALAGVMGGEETEVDDQTQNLVLEAAIFEPVVIRRSARGQSLRTESSTRYERGINSAQFETAWQRAIALILELAGGKVTEQAKGGQLDLSPRQVSLRYHRLEQILGPVKAGTIPPNTVEKILTDLGCQLTQEEAGTWLVTIPPYRHRDLEREIDLIEEVARLYGYDQFLEELPNKTQPGYLPANEILKRQLRTRLQAIGLTEVVHYSLVSPTGKEITLNNPLFSEYSALRSDLLPGLIDAFAYNLSQGNGALNAFEIGRVFQKNPTGYTEKDTVAGIMGGDLQPVGNWTRSGKPAPLNWYEAKGLLESVWESFKLVVSYQADASIPYLHPGRTAKLLLGSEVLGIFGQLHPEFTTAKDLPRTVYVFEISLPVLEQSLSNQQMLTPIFKPYSTYPGVTRDLAFFAPTEVTVAELAQVMKQAGGNLLTQVELFDQYQGENVPPGQRSLAFSLVYRESDRTLTDTEIDPIHQQVRTALVEKFPVSLRS